METGNPPSFRKIWAAIREVHKVALEQRIVETPNIRISRTSAGQRPEVISTPKASRVGMVFRGEWSPDGVVHPEQDVVVIPSGADAGTYVCIKEHTSSALIAPIPLGQDGHGEYWYQLQLNQKSAVVWS